MKLGCVIMAAGSSSRFGSNKLLQVLDGKPLYRRALEAVPTEAFVRVCVVTGYAPVAEQAQRMGFVTVWNDRPEQGISRTIRLGLENLTDCDGVLFMTADQPMLTRQTLRRLAETFVESGGIAAVSHAGKRGNPCLFSRELFPELLALEGDTGGASVIKAHPELLRLMEVPAAELADCDTEEALAALKGASNGLY